MDEQHQFVNYALELDAVEPIEKRRVQDQVYDRLKSMILLGHLRPGQQLPSERELAARLQVGRAAVREAIDKLNRLGLLDRKVGRGTFVRKPTLDAYLSQLSEILDVAITVDDSALSDLWVVRRILEVEIAGLAATHASTEDLQTLRDVLERSRNALENRPLYSELSMRFHHQLAVASKNQILVIMMASLRLLLFKYFSVILERPSSAERSLWHHEQIYDRLVHRDSEGARLAMARHMDEVRIVLPGERRE